MPKKRRCDMCTRRKPLKRLMPLEDRGYIVAACRNVEACDRGRGREDARFFRGLLGNVRARGNNRHYRRLVDRNVQLARGWR
jgi:hypothetical protein